jgi:pyruvate dehydrogenase E2 component (dihydrolipoamide acetyltransferase)
MAIEVKIPQISEGVESAQVIEILVSEGDSVKEGQSLIAVETDKASVEVPSSDSGKVKEIKVKEGDEVKVGDVILILEEEGEEDGGEDEKEKDKKKEDKKAKEDEEDKDEDEEQEDKKKEDVEAEDKNKEEDKEKEENKKKEEGDEEDEIKEDKEGKSKKKEEKEDKEKTKDKQDKESEEEGYKKEKSEKEKEGDEKEGDSDQVAASPKIRRLAREIGVSLKEVSGSGPGGRITEEDVKSQSKEKKEKPSKEATQQTSLPDFSKWGAVEKEPLSNIRKTTAKATANSWQTIPHVFQFDEADISGIEEYMEKNQEKAEKAGGKLTITAILVKVMANALQQFPRFNASVDMENEEVILKKYYSIGIAVDTEKGLLVPVIRDVEKKTIIEIAVEITELSEKTRNGELSPEEMQGGNISISNLGGIGGTNFTPIVYPPQVAILGVSRAKQQPVYREGGFEPRQILPMSLSYDHRLIDGADGAKFLRWICQALEDPYKALLGA